MDTRTTVGRAFADGLREEMRRDERIFVMGNDLVRGGAFGQTRGLAEEFGLERVRDTPISEAAMAAAGVGASLNGMRPVVDFNFIDFGLGAMDEIVNQAAKMRYMFRAAVPVVFFGTAGVAAYAAQHNNSMEAWFAHTPGLVVVFPSTPADTKGLLKSALRGEDPVVFLVAKRSIGTRGPVSENADAIPIGRACVCTEGEDVTVVTYGAPVQRVLAAADALTAQRIRAEVIDLRSLSPWDVDTVLASVRKTGRLVVVTEEPPFAGIASEVAATVEEAAHASLRAPVRRVTARQSGIPHSPPLIEAMIPQSSDVQRAVEALLGLGQARRRADG